MLARASTMPLALAALLAAASPASASLISDAPPGTGGFQTITPFRGKGTGGSHVQEVYTSALFGNFTGPRAIREIDFRTYPGAPVGALLGNTLNLSNVRLSLSTTAFGDETTTPLGTDFAANLGADSMVVYDGALSLKTTNPGSFDFVVTLQNAYTYDPSKGNLLLDVVVPDTALVSTNGILGFVNFDDANNYNDGVYSVYNLSDGRAKSGVVSTDGTIARFISDPATPVPEPVSIALLGAGLMGLGLVRRTGRRVAR